MLRNFPTLFKKTSTGKIQEWTIWVDGNVIVTRFGQVGGKVQTTTDTIKEGKNIGRANASSPEQQAELEAQSQWEKKKKKGYVETKDDAENGKVDDLIEGGVEPMLAQPFSKHGDKIAFPAYHQPKLDGIRCVAILEEGVCTLWTRTRKRINSVPHIVAEMERAFPGQSRILDGELYNHEWKADFEKIVSIVRHEEPCEGHEDVQYHVYDMVSPEPFSRRSDTVQRLVAEANSKALVAVNTAMCDSVESLMEAFNRYRELGYEGAMVRQAVGAYEKKRSYGLQKVKEFEDAEFPIKGVVEGRGKLAGHVGAFTCMTAEGELFEVKMEGGLSRLKDFFDNPSLWQEKRMTVRFQGLTSRKVPRFPIGVRIRTGAE